MQTLGTTQTFYNIAELNKAAFLEADTPTNKDSDFLKPEIWPLNKLAFGNDDLAPIEIYTLTFHELAAA